jgi:hypothetical protein
MKNLVGYSLTVKDLGSSKVYEDRRRVMLERRRGRTIGLDLDGMYWCCEGQEVLSLTRAQAWYRRRGGVRLARVGEGLYCVV